MEVPTCNKFAVCRRAIPVPWPYTPWEWFESCASAWNVTENSILFSVVKVEMLIVKTVWIPCFEGVGPEFLPFVADRVKSDRAKGSWVGAAAGEGVVTRV